MTYSPHHGKIVSSAIFRMSSGRNGFLAGTGRGPYRKWPTEDRVIYQSHTENEEIYKRIYVSAIAL